MLFPVSIFLIVSVHAQDFQTLNYFTYDTISLELDVLLPEQIDTRKTPLVIYVHGGGFKNGDREGGHAYARHLWWNKTLLAHRSRIRFI